MAVTAFGRHSRHGRPQRNGRQNVLHEWLDGVDDESTSTLRQHRLMEADEDIEQARKALSEDHAPGVERALARAESALIEVDPLDDSPVAHDHGAAVSVLSTDDDLDVVDLT